MNTRMRSPSYPGTPLPEAVAMVGKIHAENRSNAIDREVAAQSMGYRGISGRSAKVLSDLIQYGLLEKAGKNGVRVSRRAIEILHPDDPRSQRYALEEAAFEPELFQRVKERFPDGLPSEGALRSYFVKESFTDAAIPSAVRAYLETYRYLEQTGGYESHSAADEGHIESVPDQRVGEDQTLRPQPHVNQPAFVRHAIHASQPPAAPVSAPDFRWAEKRIWLAGVVENKAQAQDVIDFIEAMKRFLPEAKESEPQKESQKAALKEGSIGLLEGPTTLPEDEDIVG